MKMFSFRPMSYSMLLNVLMVEPPVFRSFTMDSVTVGLPWMVSTLVASTVR